MDISAINCTLGVNLNIEGTFASSRNGLCLVFSKSLRGSEICLFLCLDLFEARTCRSVDRSLVSFSARASSGATRSSHLLSKASTVANIDTTALDGCSRAGGAAPSGSTVRPTGRHYPVAADLDPTRGHSSVNPCDYDDVIDMKVRTTTYGDDGDWKESAEYESGVSLLTDGSEDGSVSEDTEVENVDYPL